MAVTVDDLKYNIDIDTDEAKKSVDDLEASTDSFEASLNAAGLAAAIFQKNIRDLEQAEQRLDAINKEVIESNDDLTSSLEKQALVIEQVNASYDLLFTRVELAVSAFRMLDTVFKVLANDEILDHIQMLSLKLKAIAYFKGFAYLNSSINLVVLGFEKINEVAKAVVAGLDGFKKYISSIAETARYIVGLDGDVERLNVSLKQENVIVDALEDSWGELNSKMDLGSKAIGLLEKSISTLGSESEMDDLRSNLFAVSVLASSKGFGGIGKTVRKISKALDEASEASQRFKEKFDDLTQKKNSFFAITKGIWNMTDGITDAASAIVEGFGEAIGDVVGLAGKFSAVYLLGIFKVGKGFKTLGHGVTAALSTDPVEKFTASMKTLKKSGDVWAFMKDSLSNFVDTFSVANDAILTDMPKWKQYATKAANGIKSLKDSVNNLGDTIGNFSKGFLGMGKIFETVSLGFTGLSHVLLSFDNSIIRTMGYISLFMSVLTGGLSAAIMHVTSLLGDMLMAMGSSVLASMDAFGQKANEVQLSTRKFELVLGNVVSELTNLSAVEKAGILDTYKDAVKEARDETVFTTKELSDAMKLLVSETRMFGLSASENVGLYNRAIEIAAGSGKDLSDVTLRMVQGLAGASQGLLALGINLKDSHVEMASMEELQGESLATLDDHSKVMLRYNDLLKQSNIFLGSNKQVLESNIGAQQRLDKEIGELTVKLGQQSDILKTLKNSFAGVISKVNELDQSYFNVIARVTDFSGVVTYSLGVVVKFIAQIFILSSTYKVLTTVVGNYVKVQEVLNKAFTFMAAKSGAQVIAVKTLTDVFKNLGNVIKAILIKDLQKLGAVMVATARKTAIFTASLLANPLTWVAAGVALLVTALYQLEQELGFVSEFFGLFYESSNKTGVEISVFGEILQWLSQMFKNLMDVIKIFVIFYVAGMARIIYMFTTVLKWATKFSDGISDMFGRAADRAEQFANKSDTKMTLLTDNFGRTVEVMAGDMDAATSDVEKHVEKVGMSVEDLTEMMESLASETDKVTKSTKSLAVSSSYADNEIGKLKTVIHLKEEELKLQEELIASQSIPMANATMNPAETTKAIGKIKELRSELSKLYKLQEKGILTKNITKDFKANDAVEKQRKETLAIMKKTKAVYDQMSMSILDDVGKIEKQRQLQQEILSEKIEEFDLQTKIVEKNLERIKQLGATRKEVKKINNLLAERLKTREALASSSAAIDGNAAIQTANVQKADPTDEAKNAGAEMGISMINAAQSGAESLGRTIISTVGEAFGVVGQVVAAVVNLLSAGYDEMKNLTTGLIDFFTNLPAMVGQGILGLVDGLIESTIKSLTDPDMLIKVSVGLAEGILQAFASAIKAIPKILKAVLNIQFWIDVVKGIVVALWEAIKEVFNAFGSWFSGEIADGVANGLKSGVKAVSDTLMGFTNDMFGVVADTVGFGDDEDGDDTSILDKAAEAGKTMWEHFKQAMIDGWGWLTGIFQKLWKGLGEAFTDIWNIWKKFPQVIWNGIKTIGKALWDIWTGFFEGVWEGIVSLFSGLWEGLRSFVSGFWEGLMEGIEGLWNGLRGFFEGIINFFKNALGGLWDGIKSLFTGFIEFFKELFTGNIGEAFTKLWQGITGLFTKTFEGVWNALKSLGKGIGDLFMGIFDGIKNMFSKLWTGIKDAFVKVANGLIDFFKKPFEGLWKGFSKAFSGIGDFFKNIFSNLFNIKPSKGTVEKWIGIDLPWIRFAEGGHVPNPDGKPTVQGNSYKNDFVQALLSPDEYVIPRSITGNKDKMDRILSIIEGRDELMPKFGFGGWVSDRVKSVTKSVGNVVSSVKKGIGNAVGGVKNVVGNVVKGVREKVGGIVKTVKQAVGGLTGKLKDIWGWVTSNLGGMDIFSFIRDPLKAVRKLMESNIGKFFKKQANNIMKGIFGNIFHDGGLVGNDGIAGLMGGEFVLNKQAVQSIGAQNLGNLNTGAIGSFSTPSQITNNSTFGDINVNISTNEVDSDFIDSDLVPSIMETLKEASLRGEFVMSEKGLR